MNVFVSGENSDAALQRLGHEDAIERVEVNQRESFGSKYVGHLDQENGDA